LEEENVHCECLGEGGGRKEIKENHVLVYVFVVRNIDIKVLKKYATTVSTDHFGD